jgi:hypothetical protein
MGMGFLGCAETMGYYMAHQMGLFSPGPVSGFFRLYDTMRSDPKYVCFVSCDVNVSLFVTYWEVQVMS